ncbi:MAG TPA: efflux RND transporter periplasmic adaptor subunit [Opitutaceae bacterium]|nr:efflux RND transporter periplasmic adaptor subunit [Opitutaceae bacterium]
MLKRTFLMLGAIAVVVAVLAFIKYRQISAMIAAGKAAKQPPVAVASTTAAAQVWQRQFHAVGSVVAVKGVTVSNELAGTIRKIAFESGDRVKQGDLLVQLDIAPDEAQLRGLKAQAELSKLNLDRAQDLRRNNTNAQADLDAAQAQYDQAVAAVDALAATIAKKVITAPFDGRLGIRQVDLGQYLAAGTPIVSLQALNPVYVDFSLPQQDVVELQIGQTVQVRVDAYDGENFPGTVTAINSKVDDATRNIEVQATLPNPQERLKPGMFASVDVVLPQKDRFVTLPQAAVVYNPYGDAVYVIEKPGADAGAAADALVARQRFVQLGETRGDQVAVLKGINPGDQVVTAGQLKLRNGAAVQINNSAQPGDNPAPQLPNT